MLLVGDKYFFKIERGSRILSQGDKEGDRLLLFEEIYKEYLPIESELETESEEFYVSFFQVLGPFEHLKEGRGGPKTYEWCRDWYHGTRGNQVSLKAMDFLGKSKRKGQLPITRQVFTSTVA